MAISEVPRHYTMLPDRRAWDLSLRNYNSESIPRQNPKDEELYPQQPDEPAPKHPNPVDFYY